VRRFQDLRGRLVRCILFDLGQTLWDSQTGAEPAKRAANQRVVALLRGHLAPDALPTTDDDLLGCQSREMVDEPKHALARRDPYRELTGRQAVADALRCWALFEALKDDEEDDEDEEDDSTPRPGRPAGTAPLGTCGTTPAAWPRTDRRGGPPCAARPRHGRRCARSAAAGSSAATDACSASSPSFTDRSACGAWSTPGRRVSHVTPRPWSRHRIAASSVRSVSCRRRC
jgi:hypothetical protein